MEYCPMLLHCIRVFVPDLERKTSLIKPAVIAHAVIWNKLHAASCFYSNEAPSKRKITTLFPSTRTSKVSVFVTRKIMSGSKVMSCFVGEPFFLNVILLPVFVRWNGK